MIQKRTVGSASRGLPLVVLSCVIAIPALTAGQPARGTDEQKLESLVHEYTRYEDAGDMASQSTLMAGDRWWHGPGGRRTDNALYMKLQERAIANAKGRYPGVTFMREVRDLRVRLLAPTVAITSFTWFANRLIPPDLPADKVQALGPAPLPTTVSLVWLRQGDAWKIVNSHHSPQYQR